MSNKRDKFYFLFAVAKVRTFFESAKFFGIFFAKKFIFPFFLLIPPIFVPTFHLFPHSLLLILIPGT